MLALCFALVPLRGKNIEITQAKKRDSKFMMTFRASHPLYPSMVFGEILELRISL